MVISKDFILNDITNTSKDVIIVSFESDVLTSVGGEYLQRVPCYQRIRSR